MKFLRYAKTIGLILLLGLFIQTQTQAQIKPTPAIMAQINAELQKRGLTEGEVRVRLIQKGIDVENIPIEQLPQYKDRVIAVLDEMQAEKAAQNGVAQQANVTPVQTAPANVVTTQGGTVQTVGVVPTQTVLPNNVVAVDQGNNGVMAVQPITTPQEAAAEAAQKVNQKAAAKKGEGAGIYGHTLFTDKTLDVFRTSDGAQAPDTYVLGEGDEVRITIFGASQTDIQQKINPDGYIQPVGTAKIFLKGLTLAQGREIINQRLSTAYTFRPDQFAVTIVTARTILVNIFGEVKITGGFNISALNSALNALAAAGGPTGIGSVRTIQHIRGSVKKNIDLYAFMSDPTVQYKYDLQQNDILYVPVANMLATIEGAVKRPMTYEMLPSESLVDLIKYAGNLTTNVLPDFVQIQRIINGEERLFEWNLADVMSGKLKVSLQNGDVVRIKESNKPMDQYVDIDGSVFYGGRYDLASNGTLQTLLANAKPMPRAKTDLVFVERMRKDETTELLSVPFPSNTNEQFKLFPRDKVHIQDLSAFRDVTTISVSGNVRNPFERSFALNDHITIKQALEWANGLKPSSFPVAYIFRHNPFKPAEIKYIQVDLNNSDNVLLQAGDQLKVYDNNTYTNIGEVRIYGAVKTPNGYTYDPTMSLQDLLVNSGGFSVGAAYNRIEVFRTEISPVEQVKMKLITVQVDSTYRLVSPLDFKLQPYDQVVVRMTPEFSLNRTIEVTGQVKYPGVYLLESKQTFLSDIVEKSGGLLDSADPEGSWLFRTYHKRGGITMSIRKAMENKGNAKFDPILFEGDVVNINRRENTVIIRQTGTMMSQYSINPENNGIKTVVFQGRKSARWYINHFAGGFDKEANKNSLTVTMPNDQMFATKKILFFRKYPTVRTGSVISLQMKPPKPVKIEENKKMDWQSFWATTLSATTALISILVLSRNL